MGNVYITPEVHITIGEIYDGIGTLIKDGHLNKNANVLWTQYVNSGSVYEIEENVVPGSVLIGLQWMDNEEIKNGTIRLSPKYMGLPN